MSSDVASRHLGIDLGATNLKWAMVELADSAWATVARAQATTRLASAPEDVPAAVVAQLGEVAAEAIRSCGPAASVGVGVPGLYDPVAGTARFLVNIPGPWAGQPIAGPVGDAAGLPAVLVNDARAFGLAELRLGAGRGASSMIGLTLGTGVGGVIAIDGRVHQGHDGTAGEIGHLTLDDQGPLCRCGSRGCLEAYASTGAALTMMAEQLPGATIDDIIEAAKAGNVSALRVFEDAGMHLAWGLAAVTNLINPGVILVGGDMSHAGDLILDSARLGMRRHVLSGSAAATPVLVASLGDRASAIGALQLAIEATDLLPDASA